MHEYAAAPPNNPDGIMHLHLFIHFDSLHAQPERDCIACIKKRGLYVGF